MQQSWDVAHESIIFVAFSPFLRGYAFMGHIETMASSYASNRRLRLPISSAVSFNFSLAHFTFISFRCNRINLVNTERTGILFR